MKMTPLRRLGFQAIGGVLTQTATWGGAIALHFLPGWLEVPTFTTALGLFVAGAVTTAYAWLTNAEGQWP